jgi:hypothetical protein
MRLFTPVLIFAFSGYAFAQAPVEERRVRQDPLLDGQQRVDFARQGVTQAEQRVQQAERQAQQDELAYKALQKHADEARAISEKSKKDLAVARSRAAEAKRAYDKESGDFARARQQLSEPAKKG